jgi:hypothetical protein
MPNQQYGEIGRCVIGGVLAIIVAAMITLAADFQIAAKQPPLSAIGAASNRAALQALGQGSFDSHDCTSRVLMDG